MFVFVYSSYHLKLSFPHLVVIPTTLETPKNIFCFKNNIMQNDNAAGIRGHYHESSDCSEYRKKSLLKSSHPKKYLPNFLTPKNPRIENFKSKKILRSSPSLDFNFLQFPSVKFSNMLRPGRVWQEETFKIEKSRGCQGSFFVFSIFVFFWLSKNLVLQIFLINWQQGEQKRYNISAKF